MIRWNDTARLQTHRIPEPGEMGGGLSECSYDIGRLLRHQPAQYAGIDFGAAYDAQDMSILLGIVLNGRIFRHRLQCTFLRLCPICPGSGSGALSTARAAQTNRIKIHEPPICRFMDLPVTYEWNKSGQQILSAGNVSCFPHFYSVKYSGN